jgi:hypothetical protein
MFRLITIDFSQKSPYFSLLSPTSPCELSEREITSPSNLKVVGALDNYSLVFVIFINFFGQQKDQIRGRSDFSFRELTGRSGRQQREVERLLGEVNCD